LGYSNNAWDLDFHSSLHYANYYGSRYNGRPVRPVQDAVKLQYCTITFDAGGGASVNSILVPVGQSIGELPTSTREGYNFLGWYTAAVDGVAVKPETVVAADMTIYARWEGNAPADAHDKVQLWEGGPYWATTNIGAEEPWESGYYFWWGDTVGYKRENDKWVASDGSNSNFSFTSGNVPTYNKSISTLQSEGWITSDGVLAPVHDAATVHWGDNWRMPTKDELSGLIDNCDWTWTTQNGVNGYIVRGRGVYASNRIFLPATGSVGGTSLNGAGAFGDYWSSDLTNSLAWELVFDSSGPITDDGFRNSGQSVRPVLGATIIESSSSLAHGVDVVNLNITTGGSADWFTQTSVAYDSQDAVQSGDIDDEESSWMQTSVEGPADVSFWWKVSSEGSYDKLKFYIDGIEQDAISGEKSWVQKTYTLGSGSHILKWVYSKDGSVSDGSDCGWVDQLVVTRKEYPNDDNGTSDVHESVQLWEGGPYWATTNIGAEKPEDAGYYFWWGDTVGYKRENNKWVASDGSNSNFSFSSGNTPTYDKSISTLQSEGWITSDGVLAPVHDAATVHWGDNWRIPTKDELSGLIDNCDWTWTTQNGVNGCVVKGRGTYASKSIFLPAAGYGDVTSLSSSGSYGVYWSSVPFSEFDFAWDLYFGTGYHNTDYIFRYYWQSVRPVQGFSK
jgi:uncharacterized repeat protein (TIGR02543 family)